MIVIQTTLMLVGMGLLSGFIIPNKNGPFNLIKILRKLGKPFTCPVCMFFWGCLVSHLLLVFFSAYHLTGLIDLFIPFSASGYAILFGHWSGYYFVTEEE